MIASKYLIRMTIVLVCVCLIVCGIVVYAADAFDTTNIPEYQKRLFGDDIITIDIQADEGDWQGLLGNAQSKEWISGDLIINGERFGAVGIRTKGNSSLTQGSRSSTARYSLQFKFNKYVKGQTYYGLDAFCINNMMGDATYMKDYISYEVMNYIGVATPLANFASVMVNGEDYGFCLALERYNKAFLDRVYSTSAGELYSVKIGMGMRGDFEDMWQDVENTFPGRRQNGGDTEGRQPTGGERPDFSQGGFPDFSEGDGRGMGAMGRGGFGGGSGGGSLIYSGNDAAGYSAIFNNAVFGTVSEKDQQRVITAIENLNAGTDLEKYFDVDEILRYFAVHTVVVNLDSYTSNMAQNYYIYERDGKITILPWDYGLAFGGFQSGSASSVVNYPIDTPVSGVSMEDRPLLNMLLEVDEYRERYHDYLSQIVEGYFRSGIFEQTIDNLYAKINEYVKNDVSAYFTYEQYQASLPALKELGRLRAESISGQLDGTIPSTSSGQNADSSSLIDASGINLSALGSMMGGGGMGMGGRQDWQRAQTGGDERQSGGRGDVPSITDRPADGGQSRNGGQGNSAQGGNFGMPGGGMFDMGSMQQAMQILMESGGELTDDVRAALLDLGLTEEQIEMYAGMLNGSQDGIRQGGFPNGGGDMIPRDGVALDGQDGEPGADANNQQVMNMQNRSNADVQVTQNSISAQYAIVIIAMLVILIGATIFIAKPRKATI